MVMASRAVAVVIEKMSKVKSRKPRPGKAYCHQAVSLTIANIRETGFHLIKAATFLYPVSFISSYPCCSLIVTGAINLLYGETG